MKAQLKVGGGDGDLPSVPGITSPIKENPYLFDWTVFKLGGIVILFAISVITIGGRGLIMRYFDRHK